MDEPVVKIMKRIRPRGTAVEACVTRHGTIVAPLMTELVGFEELTPYKGGWCGNEIFADPFTRSIRDKTRRMTYAIGERLKEEGYRGYFELDFLIDEDTGQVYLGELNPRITGASSITNHAVFALSDMPLFMFHLLEWMDVDYDLSVRQTKPALGQAREHRRLEPARDQTHRRHRRGRDRGPADRHLAHGRSGTGSLLPLRHPPPRCRERARGLLPAHHRHRRLLVRGRRPGHSRHPGPPHDRRLRAQRAGQGLDLPASRSASMP